MALLELAEPVPPLPPGVHQRELRLSVDRREHRVVVEEDDVLAVLALLDDEADALLEEQARDEVVVALAVLDDVLVRLVARVHAPLREVREPGAIEHVAHHVLHGHRLVDAVVSPEGEQRELGGDEHLELQHVLAPGVLRHLHHHTVEGMHAALGRQLERGVEADQIVGLDGDVGHRAHQHARRRREPLARLDLADVPALRAHPRDRERRACVSHRVHDYL